MAWVKAVWRERNGEVEGTVPNTWVNMAEEMVYWPAVSNAKQHLAERRQPKNGWRTFPLIKVKFHSDYFEECEAYAETSTAELVDDDEEDTLPAKRQKKKKGFPDCDTDGGSSDMDVEPNEPDEDNPGSPELFASSPEPVPEPPKKLVPEPPKKLLPVSARASSAIVRPKEKGTSQLKTASSTPSPHPQASSTPSPHPQASSRSSSHPQASSRSSSHPEASSRSSSHPEASSRSSSHPMTQSHLSSETPDAPGGSEPASPDVPGSNTTPQKKRSKTCRLISTPNRRVLYTPTRRSHPFPMQEGKFQRRVLELLVAIRDGLADLKLEKERETSGSNPLPEQVTTLEELNSLDQTLTDASVRQQLVNSLAMVGGKLKDNVRRVMEKVMSNNVMAQFNMKGAAKGTKMAFVKLRLYNVIIESVMKSTSNETEANIAEQMAIVLKYAPDKVGGGGRKKE